MIQQFSRSHPVFRPLREALSEEVLDESTSLVVLCQKVQVECVSADRLENLLLPAAIVRRDASEDDVRDYA